MSEWVVAIELVFEASESKALNTYKMLNAFQDEVERVSTNRVSCFVCIGHLFPKESIDIFGTSDRILSLCLSKEVPCHLSPQQCQLLHQDQLFSRQLGFAFIWKIKEVRHNVQRQTLMVPCSKL
jgi:hypothetical protein